MKKIYSPNCPFCPSEIHTIRHLFIECSQANYFSVEFQDWYGNHSGKKLHLMKQANSFSVEFQDWYGNHSGKKLHLLKLDVLYGVFHSSRYCSALNHLIGIIGKYYLYINASARNKFQFGEFKTLLSSRQTIIRKIHRV